MTDSDSDSVNYTKLIDDKKTQIKYIYHLSDIHIRKNTLRSTEYAKVFKRTYAMISKDLDPDSLIVITGDILHY
ncbi:MAG TPA: hypothetical protein VKR58_06715, partial [Aquella sp.]|nr:hypothetical protein [Aquella sp.]